MARTTKTPEVETSEAKTPEVEAPKRNKDGFIVGQAIDPKEYAKFVAEQRAKANK